MYDSFGVTMTGLTMSLLTGFPALVFAMSASAQRYTSPPINTSAVIDGDHITIDYYAPSMHGRKIMGGLVPYGQVWCTGANWATKITTAADLDVNGLRVPKGSYSIWTLPNEKQWMLIMNKTDRSVPLRLRSEPGFRAREDEPEGRAVAGGNVQDRAATFGRQ